jgi:RNA polymerase-binding transcription factor DksA
MESRICVKCKEEINPLRVKALPNTKTCVNCSTVGAKRGVPVMFGSKDHTWTDLVVMEENEFKAFNDRKKNKSKGFDKFDN